MTGGFVVPFKESKTLQNMVDYGNGVAFTTVSIDISNDAQLEFETFMEKVAWKRKLSDAVQKVVNDLSNMSQEEFDQEVRKHMP